MKPLPSRLGPNCVVTFGTVVVYPRMRELRVNGQLVEVNGCAFELMLMLIEARGRVVSKKELFHRVWPNALVADANLRVNMWKLRKLLGENAKAIKTVPTRGYVLTAPVRITGEDYPPSVDGVGDPRDEIHMKQAHAATVATIDDDDDVRETLLGRCVGQD